MAHEVPEPPRRLRAHGSIGTSIHGTPRGVLRSTDEATVTSLAAEGAKRRQDQARERQARRPGGAALRPDGQRRSRRRGGEGKPHGDASCPLPLERLPRRNLGRYLGSRHTPTLLRLPRGSPLSDLGSVRSAHSCGAALVLYQLPCSQHPRVRHPGLLRPDTSWGTLPLSPGPCKSKCAAGAVRVVHTPSARLYPFDE